jgi:hypothetical protein
MIEEAIVLKNANGITRQMVMNYLQKHELSLNAFSKLVGIRQPNLFQFMSGKRLSSKSIEKLGEFFSK